MNCPPERIWVIDLAIEGFSATQRTFMSPTLQNIDLEDQKELIGSRCTTSNVQNNIGSAKCHEVDASPSRFKAWWICARRATLGEGKARFIWI